MKNYFFLLLYLMICGQEVLAQAEVDTIPEYYRHYMFQWVDDSAVVCYHDSSTCARIWYDIRYHGGSVNPFNDYMFSLPCLMETLAAQYEVSDSTIIVGIAAVLDTDNGWIYDIDRDTICSELSLYKPVGANMQLLESGTICLDDFARRIKVPSIPHSYPCPLPPPYDEYVKFFSTYEVYFDEPVVVTDSFCIGWSPLYERTSGLNDGLVPIVIREAHINCKCSANRMPLNKMRYRLNGDPPDAPWHLSQEHWVLCLMPIVERPCDTCGVVRDFRQQWIADQTLFVQWDTLPNHTSWQLSYCAAGTDPDHGTIVDCPLPQAVVGNVVGASDMVFHVRARCKDIRWRQWSPWSEAQPVALNAVEAPDGGPDALTVSPNPTTGALHIDCGAAITAVELYSLRGELLLAQPAHRSTALDLDISSLPQALYLLLVHTDKGTHSRVVAKQ